MSCLKAPWLINYKYISAFLIGLEALEGSHFSNGSVKKNSSSPRSVPHRRHSSNLTDLKSFCKDECANTTKQDVII